VKEAIRGLRKKGEGSTLLSMFNPETAREDKGRLQKMKTLAAWQAGWFARWRSSSPLGSQA